MVAVLVMFILFVLFPAVVGSMVVSARKAGGGRGEELRLSELERLIDAAVEDAAAPLRRRIETLEAIVTDDEPDRQRLDPAALADALGEPDEPAAVRRRTRA